MSETTSGSVRWDRAPVTYMVPSLRDYLENGIPTGSYMRAVLENDLYSAVFRADATNAIATKAWVRFLLDEFPSDAYGSKDTVARWIKHGGRAGLSVPHLPVGTFVVVPDGRVGLVTSVLKASSSVLRTSAGVQFVGPDGPVSGYPMQALVAATRAQVDSAGLSGVSGSAADD